jgi:hypothetical protein
VTSIADMVEQMLAANAPAPAIVAAVRAMECVTSVTRDVTPPSRVTKRDGNRKRQAARRNRLKLAALAQEAQANDGAVRHAHVTRDSVTTPLLDSVVLTSLLTKEASKESKKEEQRVRARGTRLMPGAALSEEHRAVIAAEGIVDPEKLWAEFVDYWSDIPGQRGTKINWTGTLRNRCRDVIKRGFNGNGNSTIRTHQTSGPAPTRDTAIIAGMGRALESGAVRLEMQMTPDGKSFERNEVLVVPPETDADGTAAADDDGPSRQLALLPAGHARR